MDLRPFIICALLGLAMLSRCDARAQVDRTDEDRRTELRLADAVSRTCAHESSFVSRADCLLVWQATRRHGDTAQERLAWLTRHSPRALRGSHWSATLPLHGDAEPLGWPASWRWETYAPRWRAMRSFVRGLIRGTPPPGGWPCSVDPDSWAGRIVDREHIREHSSQLRALDCRDPLTGEPTRNEGFRWR